ncbi:hypothetical protein DSN88_09165, partial [Campylobacter jejuni]|nr:hypothetical protein [Campylobacter jejuni]
GTGIRMAGGTISTFDNKGLIKTNSADGYGIYITGGVSIDTLKNTGTIQGATQNGDGIRIKGSNVTINQIDNSGIIESADEAIGIKDWDYRIKVHTIKNSGTLKGTIIGIVGLNADIDLIENSGTIITGQYNVTEGGSAAIQLHTTNVGTIINSGYIKSASTYGIQLITAYSSNTLKTLINTGTIEGKMDGLFIGQGTSTEYIENTGVIKGGNAGINVDFKSWNHQKSGTVGTIVNKDSGEIVGDNYGIIIPTSSADYKVEAVKIESGKVEGTNGAGIALGADQDISTSIEISGKDTVVTGGKAGIVNEGNLGADGSGGITISNGATITSNSGNGSGIV